MRRLFRSDAVAAGLGLVLVLTVGCSSSSKSATPAGTSVAGSPTAAATGYKDASYEVEGKVVQLVGGVSQVPAAPGSAAMVVTKYFGNDATGDLNGDGQADVAFIITQNSGGSGTFFYVVVALKTATGWTGTNAVLIGDRIAPQTTLVSGGQVTVNYADRKPGEPMTTQPSVGVSKYLKVVGGKLAAQ